jgi:hypothetical protein
VDPETKERFEGMESALVRMADRVDRLAEAQEGLTATVSILASAQARTEERVGGLAATLSVLASAQARTEERLGRLSDAVMRGFTQASERHGEIMDRLDKLETKQ